MDIASKNRLWALGWPKISSPAFPKRAHHQEQLVVGPHLTKFDIWLSAVWPGFLTSK